MSPLLHKLTFIVLCLVVLGYGLHHNPTATLIIVVGLAMARMYLDRRAVRIAEASSPYARRRRYFFEMLDKLNYDSVGRIVYVLLDIEDDVTVVVHIQRHTVWLDHGPKYGLTISRQSEHDDERTHRRHFLIRPDQRIVSWGEDEIPKQMDDEQSVMLYSKISVRNTLPELPIDVIEEVAVVLTYGKKEVFRH